MKVTPFMRHALRVIQENENIPADWLASLLWPDHPKLQNMNHAGVAGHNLNRAATGYRSKLEKHGYLYSTFHPLYGRNLYFLTQKGRDALAEPENKVGDA